MSAEKKLATFVVTTDLGDVPVQAQRIVRHILTTVVGTAIAGANEDGVRQASSIYAMPAEAHSARLLVHGHRIQASAAATLNGLMARALDYCDAMAPGLHVGSSLVPAALAAAELVGGCSGREFLAALTVGAEVSSRMNLSEQAYAGLDPTGIAGVFGATAACARILGLTIDQTQHALALAFNRCGGSFQSNIDGSLAVRMIQGWVAGDGLTCARLAQAGLTGPENFVGGVYGYARLYAKDPEFESRVCAGLGDEYKVLGTMFKKYPSCGMTQGATELALNLLALHRFNASSISSVRVRVPGYGYRLVGHEFNLGNNPRVNAQFSIQYCIANALVRRSATLDHFRPEMVNDATVLALTRQVQVQHDPSLDAREHTSVALSILLEGGEELSDELDIAPGFPGNDLSDKDHADRFSACLAYAAIGEDLQKALLDRLLTIEQCGDVRELVDLTLTRTN